MIINAGIKRIIYQEKYPDELARKLFKEAGVIEIYYE
jgi:dCMP deaminase